MAGTSLVTLAKRALVTLLLTFADGLTVVEEDSRTEEEVRNLR